MKDLRQRAHRPEQLDNLHMGGETLHQTLDELSRLNRLIGNTATVSRAVLKMVRSLPEGESVRIVDLGCGGGDLLLSLARLLRTQGIEADLLGIEGNPHSVEYAQQQAADFPEVRFETGDILHENFACPVCDVVVSSHFLYHFSDQQLKTFLEKNQNRVRIGWVISELHRSAIAYQFFRVMGPLLGLQALTRADGLLAIRRAFRREELESIFRQMMLHRYSIRWIWSFRYLITLYPHNHG